jgi:D-psicose/D-tagatose/L-ribulose 3-epimerase
MRLAISNIAWDTSEDEGIAHLLQRWAIDAIDVAPGKYFPDLRTATDREIGRVREWWGKRGIEITGMQSLLFGTSGLNIFGARTVQDAMLEHLAAVCRIGAGLGASRLVFGSPRNRDRSGLADQQAMDIAVAFFRRLGEVAQSFGVRMCLEPNPLRYGANFMTTFAETARIVEAVAHSAVGLQVDTGALSINGENVALELERRASLIGHIHASEPDLAPLGNGGVDHAGIFAALSRYLPNHVVCIEMLATKDEPHPASIERALAVAIGSYRGGTRGGAA